MHRPGLAYAFRRTFHGRARIDSRRQDLMRQRGPHLSNSYGNFMTGATCHLKQARPLSHYTENLSAPPFHPRCSRLSAYYRTIPDPRRITSHDRPVLVLKTRCSDAEHGHRPYSMTGSQCSSHQPSLSILFVRF